MKTHLAIILCILSLGIAAFAQQPFNNPDPASREQVLKMLDAMQSRKMINSVMDTMRKQASVMMNQQLDKSAPNASPEMRAEMAAAMQDMMKDMEPLMGDMMEQMVPVYQKHLSSREVDAATAFYLSPEGQSFMNKMPLIMRDSMSLMMKSMTAKMEPIQEKLMKRMQEIEKKYAPQGKMTPDSKKPTAAVMPDVKPAAQIGPAK